MKQRILLAIGLVCIIIASALLRDFVLPHRTQSDGIPATPPAVDSKSSGSEISADKLPLAVAETLNHAHRLTLLSLDPLRVRRNPLEESPEEFRDYRVLGKMNVDGAECEGLIKAVYQAISASDGSTGGCFEPRHGIRINSAVGDYEMLICFHCRQLIVYTPDGSHEMVRIADSPNLFNQTLTAANVPLPTD